jgi:hypothetical protein
MLIFHADEVRVDPSPSNIFPDNCYIDYQTDLIATSFPTEDSPSSSASILQGNMLLPLSAHISSSTVHIYLHLWYQTVASAAGKTSVKIYDFLQGLDVPDRAGSCWQRESGHLQRQDAFVVV